MTIKELYNANKFLSTLSLRRATGYESVTPRVQSYFYPRSPCGERRGRQFHNCHISQISIHALLAESDFLHAWGGTETGISIHALLAESD